MLVRDSNIETASVVVLEPPAVVARVHPVPHALTRDILSARESVERILDGTDLRMLAIVGPCSIHDMDSALAYADRLAEIAQEVHEDVLVVMRLYFAKPRSTLGWKGLFYDPDLTENGGNVNKGARLIRNIALEVACRGLPIATEVLDPYMIQYIDELVSWSCIGARTVESQLHRELASGLSMPVGMKNAVHGSVRSVVDAVETAGKPHRFWGVDTEGRSALFPSKGNRYAHVVLRGTDEGPNFGPEAVADVHALLKARALRTALVIDCSHGNSRKDYKQQGTVLEAVLHECLAGNKNVVGFMLESNLVAGNQPLLPDKTKLTFGQSITDACIDIDETRELLLFAAARLRLARML